MNVFLFVVAMVILAVVIFLPARDRLARIFLAIIAIAILAWIFFIGFGTTKVVTEKLVTLPAMVACEPVSCTPVACEPVSCTPVSCEPVEPVVAAPVVCDPSTIPFTDMGELNPAVSTTINGPAIYEWWTGGTNEGVQRVDAGHSITIHGAKGHYWTLPNQQGLDCAWSLHVSNYGAKPQHEGKTYDQLVVPPPASLLK